MQNKPLFSIIIPHYNIPEMLDKLLSSIPNDLRIEVIVVDDKSNKNLETYNACKDNHANKNIYFVDNSSDEKGAGKCRNIGIEASNGEWLLFADSDDYFEEGFLSTLLDSIDDEADLILYPPKSVSTETGMASDRHLEQALLIRDYMNNSSYQNELRLRFLFVAPWSKLIRASLVREMNIRFENHKIANDIMFSRKVGVYANKIKAFPESIYCVSYREGSITTWTDVDSFDIWFASWLESTLFVKRQLSSRDWKLAGINGSSFIEKCIRNRYGLKKVISVCIILLRNGISPVSSIRTALGTLIYILKLRT